MTLAGAFRLGTALLLMVAALGAARHASAEDAALPYEMTKPGLDVGVVVADMETAKKFYGKGLGLSELPPLGAPLPGGGDMTRYQCGATTIKLRTYPTAPPSADRGVMNANGMRLLTIYVKDPAAISKSLTDNGYRAPRFGATQPAGYQVAFTRDPDGNQIEFLHYPEDKKDETYQKFQIGLTVTDAEKAREFYGKVLGLKEREPIKMSNPPDTMEYLFEAGVTTVKFWAPKGERPSRTGPIGEAQGIRYFTFLVKDVDATHAALKAKGVKITTPPMDLGTVARIMLIADPDGNQIEFAQRKPQPAP